MVIRRPTTWLWSDSTRVKRHITEIAICLHAAAVLWRTGAHSLTVHGVCGMRSVHRKAVRAAVGHRIEVLTHVLGLSNATMPALCRYQTGGAYAASSWLVMWPRVVGSVCIRIVLDTSSAPTCGRHTAPGARHRNHTAPGARHRNHTA